MKNSVIVIRGRLDWAKIVGDARPYTGNPKYDKGPYWSVDITPDAASRELIKKFGIASKLKTPKEGDPRTETYMVLTVLESRADGKKNNPPTIVDITGKPWDGSLIGNGSIGDVKVKVVDYGETTGAYLQAVRILDHVPYESNTFEAVSEDDEFFAAAKSDASAAFNEGVSNIDDLDDEIV